MACGAAPVSLESTSPSVPAAPGPTVYVPATCGDAIESSVASILGSQLDAFVAGDFATAYGLASRSFRSGVDLDGFTRIIREGYPEVARSTAHDMASCVMSGPEVVFAVVAVTGANGRTVEIDYRFVLEAGGWHVDGASSARATTTV